MKEKITDVANKIDKSSVANKTYDDLFQPTMKFFGTTLYRTVKSAFAPLRGLIWSAETFEEWLYTKVSSHMEETSEEDIITPDPLVAVPLIEQVRISGMHEHLKDLYAKLLAKSMNKNEADAILPSYVSIIKELSSLDVKILDKLKENRLMLVDLIYVLKDGSTATAVKNLSTLEVGSIDNIRIAIDNIIRLNLAEIPFDKFIWPESNYDVFYLMPLYKEAESRVKQDVKFEKCKLLKKQLILTDFGKSFIETCS